MPDSKKSGGAYVDCAGTVRKIDKYNRTLVMTDNTVIPIEQISRICGLQDCEIDLWDMYADYINGSVKLQKSIWILSRSTKRYSTGTGKEK